MLLSEVFPMPAWVSLAVIAGALAFALVLSAAMPPRPALARS
jgi:hypothetical protein